MTAYRITEIRIDHPDSPDFALVQFDTDPNDGRDVADVHVYHSPRTFGWGPDRVLRIGWARMYGAPWIDEGTGSEAAFAALRDRTVAFANEALEVAHNHAVALDVLQHKYGARLDPELLHAIGDDEEDIED